MNDWDSVHRGNYYSTRIVLNAHCKVNGISIHLVATSSGLNFLEKGKQVIEIDSSSFLGGNGNRLGPMGYCVAGISSCFLATFATIAASQGVRLTRLNANVECGINFAKTFDVADEPITEGITVRINAESDNADISELRRMLKMSEERCPAMYSMTHAIKVNTTVPRVFSVCRKL